VKEQKQQRGKNRGILLDRLAISHPIFLAPMAGGPGTPELVAAVSNAGGLGSFGGAYNSPQTLAQEIARIRTLTDRPFAINLFAGAYQTNVTVNPSPMLEILSAIHAEWGLPKPSLPVLDPNPFPAQLEIVLEAKPTAFSFTFGIPSREQISRLQTKQIFVMGTATTVREAAMLEEAGVDAIIAQGSEAGAHRGSFAEPFEVSMVPTRELVQAIVQAIRLPVVASGGLMDGSDIGRMLAAGAAAVQLGTAFLPCPECGASIAYKRAILSAKKDTTEITRAFSGRPARGLRNRFMEMLSTRQDVILPYPIQNTLTRPMRTEAGKRGNAEYLSLWAGQGVARARQMPAGELMQRLVEEFEAAEAARGLASA
jgi:nitronate monooxygenase